MVSVPSGNFGDLTAGLLVQDEIYLNSLKELQDNLSILRVILPALVVITGCVGFLSAYLTNRRRKKELAVMRCIGLFAVSPVQDLAAALDWYALLFGRGPDDRPIPDLAQWYLDGHGFQVMREPGRAGHGMATLVVPDIEAERARLAGVGIDTGDIVRGDFGAIARIDDPEGNRITLAEPPSRG